MLVLAIGKQTGEEILGKLEYQDDCNTSLKDVFRIQWVMKQEGHTPIAVDFPTPSLPILLTKPAFENFSKVFLFENSKYWFFEEKNINDEVIDWYNKVQAEKVGINITSEMPKPSNDKSKIIV